MDSKRVRMVVGMCTAAVALTFLVASPQAWAQGEDVAEPSPADIDADALLDEPAAEPEGVQVAEGPRAAIFIGSCLPSSPLSCAQLPVPQGGSCSCQSQLEPVRCKACDGSFKGQVLKTTCTIRPAPCQGICDIQPVTTRTGYSCTPL